MRMPWCEHFRLRSAGWDFSFLHFVIRTTLPISFQGSRLCDGDLPAEIWLGIFACRDLILSGSRPVGAEQKLGNNTASSQGLSWPQGWEGLWSRDGPSETSWAGKRDQAFIRWVSHLLEVAVPGGGVTSGGWLSKVNAQWGPRAVGTKVFIFKAGISDSTFRKNVGQLPRTLVKEHLGVTTAVYIVAHKRHAQWNFRKWSHLE